MSNISIVKTSIFLIIGILLGAGAGSIVTRDHFQQQVESYETPILGWIWYSLFIPLCTLGICV